MEDWYQRKAPYPTNITRVLVYYPVGCCRA